MNINFYNNLCLFIRKKKYIFYTDVNNILLIYCYIFPNYKNLYSIITCSSVGIFFAFNYAITIDKTAINRFSKKMYLSERTFRIGNIFVHGLPFVYVLYYRPTNIYFIHSFYSLLLYIIWLAIASKVTMSIDNIYIKFNPNDLKKIYSVKILSNILTVVLIKNLN